jgi:hypothetical protein
VTIDLTEQGRARAREYVNLLIREDTAAADELLAGLDLRDLTFLGAGLTGIAHTDSRQLPAAQRAQANTRRERLTTLRNGNRDDPEGVRVWLRRLAEEILLLRSLQERAARVLS